MVLVIKGSGVLKDVHDILKKVQKSPNKEKRERRCVCHNHHSSKQRYRDGDINLVHSVMIRSERKCGVKERETSASSLITSDFKAVPLEKREPTPLRFPFPP